MPVVTLQFAKKKSIKPVSRFFPSDETMKSEQSLWQKGKGEKSFFYRGSLPLGTLELLLCRLFFLFLGAQYSSLETGSSIWTDSRPTIALDNDGNKRRADSLRKRNPEFPLSFFLNCLEAANCAPLFIDFSLCFLSSETSLCCLLHGVFFYFQFSWIFWGTLTLCSLRT